MEINPSGVWALFTYTFFLRCIRMVYMHENKILSATGTYIRKDWCTWLVFTYCNGFKSKIIHISPCHKWKNQVSVNFHSNSHLSPYTRSVWVCIQTLKVVYQNRIYTSGLRNPILGMLIQCFTGLINEWTTFPHFVRFNLKPIGANHHHQTAPFFVWIYSIASLVVWILRVPCTFWVLILVFVTKSVACLARLHRLVWVRGIHAGNGPWAYGHATQ